MPIEQALNLAIEKGMDLVEVSPIAKPPVCKIIDYGKFKFQQSRSEKKVKRIETKGVRLSLKIDQHDMLVKQNQQFSTFLFFYQIQKLFLLLFYFFFFLILIF